MYIKRITLKNFRNYSQQEVELGDKINVFYGDNAQGKTNLLEAVFLCAMGKSFRAKKEFELIQKQKEVAKIELEYQKKDREGKIELTITQKKEVLINGVKIKKLSELLGNIHVILFSPEDIEIVKDGPQRRRRFLNMMISQLRPNYLYQLNKYQKTIEQRNNLLREIKSGKSQESFLEIWDEKLVEHGIIIARYRKEFLEKLQEKILPIHTEITKGEEKIKLIYETDSLQEENFLEKLKKNRKLDILRGYTTKGIHRDEIKILLNGEEISIFGSQGQQRTAVLSLKIAELEVVKEEIEEEPILLLDDFMSELDEKRRKRFLSNITETQVLITGTHQITLENLEYNVYNVKSGKIERKE